MELLLLEGTKKDSHKPFWRIVNHKKSTLQADERKLANVSNKKAEKLINGQLESMFTHNDGTEMDMTEYTLILIITKLTITIKVQTG